AQRLFVRVAIQPVVENAGASAKRRPAALERRPGDAKARADVVVVARTHFGFVAKPRTERKVSANPDIVLHVETCAQVEVLNARIPDAPRVAGRLTRLIGGQALERIRPEVVRRVVSVKRRAIEENAGAHRMDAPDV